MSDIWFVCKRIDKVVELGDCLECKEPKNCLSLASYQQGRADAIDNVLGIIEEHRKLNQQDYDDNIIDEDNYMYRDDECLALIEKVEQLKEQKK